MKEHSSLKPLEKAKEQAERESKTPELLKITLESKALAQKVTELHEIRDTLYEGLAKKAQEVYAPQIQQLFEQVSKLFVTDQELKQLTVEVLLDLKRVLAKY